MGKKLAQLPGAQTIWIDLDTIVCVRTEASEHGALVVVHTTEGFAVAQTPREDQSAGQLATDILALL